MFSISDQIAHEKKHAVLSAERFYFKQDTLRNSERGDEVDAARRIMRDRLEEVGRAIEESSQKKGGVGGKYNQLITTVATFDGVVDFNVLAYLGIQSIFMSFIKDTTSDWVTLVTMIASKLEYEHKFRKFENENPGYVYTVMQSMADQQVSSYQHIRQVMSKKMSDFEMEWTPWDSHTKVQIANKILIAIVTTLDDVFFRAIRYENNKRIAYVATTPLADDWLAEFEAERGFMNPEKLPTLIEPLPWIKGADGVTRGGYYSSRLSSPFVKAYTPQHRAFIAEHTMQEHLDAVNKMQGTAWKINSRVLAVQKEMFINNISHPGLPSRQRVVIPDPPASIAGLTKTGMTEEQLEELKEFKEMAKSLHRSDRARKGKVVQFKMAYDTACMYEKYDSFHYVYTADFRGRVYAETTGLSPQGNDTSKALLVFAKSKCVTESGLFWLAVHGANTFGNDKVSFQQRVDWIYDNEDRLRATADDPVGYREWWGSADKPWQFLAFVFAWAGTAYGKDPTAHTNIPIGLDGSCNGIQHYSAVLRDKIGGAGVNLINSDLPADIYQEVSDELRNALVRLPGDDMAAHWLRTGLGRKLTKRPVMTLPYGSTQTSAREYIHEWALENQVKFPGMSPKEIYRACIWLTPHLWTAIGNVVIAARVGMSWIQQRVTKITRSQEDAITWTSPAGFPVYQPYMEQDIVNVQTKTSGGIVIKVSMQEPTTTVARSKQRSGIAPNFVHSLDSSHMIKVVNSTDFGEYAMIHDDFGTQACHVSEMYTAIRQEFVKMYQEHQPLREWSAQQGDYKGEFPALGELDIMDVLDSEYFFG